jgi:hypothetical protein
MQCKYITMRIQNSKLQETHVGTLFFRLRMFPFTILSAPTIFSGHLLRQQPEYALRDGDKKDT